MNVSYFATVESLLPLYFHSILHITAMAVTIITIANEYWLYCVPV